MQVKGSNTRTNNTRTNKTPKALVRKGFEKRGVGVISATIEGKNFEQVNEIIIDKLDAIGNRLQVIKNFKGNKENAVLKFADDDTRDLAVNIIQAAQVPDLVLHVPTRLNPTVFIPNLPQSLDTNKLRLALEGQNSSLALETDKWGIVREIKSVKSGQSHYIVEASIEELAKVNDKRIFIGHCSSSFQPRRPPKTVDKRSSPTVSESSD